MIARGATLGAVVVSNALVPFCSDGGRAVLCSSSSFGTRGQNKDYQHVLIISWSPDLSVLVPLAVLGVWDREVSCH